MLTLPRDKYNHFEAKGHSRSPDIKMTHKLWTVCYAIFKFVTNSQIMLPGYYAGGI